LVAGAKKIKNFFKWARKALRAAVDKKVSWGFVFRRQCFFLGMYSSVDREEGAMATRDDRCGRGQHLTRATSRTDRKAREPFVRQGCLCFAYYVSVGRFGAAASSKTQD
jgi:hypothetical protein